MTTAVMNTSSRSYLSNVGSATVGLLSAVFASDMREMIRVGGKSLEMARAVGDGSRVSAAKVAKVRAIADTL